MVGHSAVDPAFDDPFYIVPSEEQRPRMVSQTLIQDVIVLQMGNFPLEDEAPTPTPAPAPEDVNGAEPTPVPTPTEPPPPPSVITLIVAPQDAVTLNYLIYSGAKLTLAMRNPMDPDRFDTEAVTLQFLLDQYRIPVPAKLPFGMEPRIDSFDTVSLPTEVTATPQP
jgi:pilus assembly protein CpaB